MTYGPLVAPAIGVVMEELVRRAILTIRGQRFGFKAEAKHGHGGKEDVVTDVDHCVQELYVRLLSACFPEYGILAEECGLRKPCRVQGQSLYFTVDPLDGTKAFARHQSHGVGTMIALVRNSRIIAAYVADVMTGEIFGYGPGSDKTRWITDFEHEIPLSPRLDLPLVDQHVVLRNPLAEHSERMQALLAPKGIFKSHQIDSGSIGLMFARMWKGEVGGVVLGRNYETPWDTTPVLGISQRLGFVFYKFTGRGPRPVRVEIPHEPYWREHELLVVHRSFDERIRSAAPPRASSSPPRLAGNDQAQHGRRRGVPYKDV
jgi:fructose-1,6-bisphosphatase/inositol monophosphatase family enzyme